MSALYRSRRLRDPRVVPTVPVEVDWSHPLAAGLIGLYVPGSPSGLSDITGIGPTLIASDGLGSFVPSSDGPGYAAPVNGGVLTSTRFPSQWALASEVSLFLLAFLNGTPGTNGNLWGLDYVGNVAPYVPWGITAGSTGAPVFFFTETTSSWNNIIGSAAYSSGRNAVGASGTMNGGAAIIYQQGVVTGSTTWSGAASYTNPAAPYVAFASDSSGRGLNGTALLGAIFDRVLSADEHAWLAAEPFAMLRTGST